MTSRQILPDMNWEQSSTRINCAKVTREKFKSIGCSFEFKGRLSIVSKSELEMALPIKPPNQKKLQAASVATLHVNLEMCSHLNDEGSKTLDSHLPSTLLPMKHLSKSCGETLHHCRTTPPPQNTWTLRFMSVYRKDFQTIHAHFLACLLNLHAFMSI